jgi:hypothetical protein
MAFSMFILSESHLFFFSSLNSCVCLSDDIYLTLIEGDGSLVYVAPSNQVSLCYI